MTKLLSCLECGEDFDPKKDGHGNSCCAVCFEGHPEEIREEGESQPLDTWKIGKYLFETFDQGSGECAVRIKERGKGTYWLKQPEAHYETEAGARYAILLFLEREF